PNRMTGRLVESLAWGTEFRDRIFSRIFSYRRTYSVALRCHDQSAFIPFLINFTQTSRSVQSASARSIVCQSACGLGPEKENPLAVALAIVCGFASMTVSSNPPVARTIGTVPCARL